MSGPFADHAADLAALAQKARLRTLRPRDGVDFASNDYLGLAGDARLKQAIVEAMERGVPTGSGGSRLLRGNHEEHEALEAAAAHFFGSESALFFANGYGGNSALVATLPHKGDVVIYDRLIHASLHEGLRLTRADRAVAEHNDVQSYADAITRWRKNGGTGRVWIAVETLYSMDGDQAPLDDLMMLTDEHDGVLLVDEAHATGVFGDRGRGLAAHLQGRENLISLHTCGKALGGEGALVCASQTVKEFLVNRARGFIFSTAPSPLMAVVVGEALRICVDDPELRHQLQTLISHAEKALAPLGFAPTGSQIVPIILGEDGRTMAAADALQKAGFDIRGIRPPTVPVGTARLRLSLTLNATCDDVDALAENLGRVLS
ncbi:8-amino-7-oxononanoate synthase [Croceicoccus estronivorus]|uniref:8-amino-7-oxononanoate synthase n=1 Tax=Croceicoccus estronivorus TaxID=1172626 RepID=UPI00082E0FE7|nr:8-amino-7-oxononanoate synthase [Croceicoccus estronivorus]OCC22558.1 8-amino-7-oxononanoate synthase [Croceicoccus estronivorus]